MFTALIASFLLCLGLGITLLRSKAENRRPLRHPASVRVIWKLSVVAVIGIGAAYIAQRHADADHVALEQRVYSLEQQVNDLQQTVTDLQNSKVDR